MLERLAHVVMRRRWWFIAAWIGLTMLGAYAAGAVSTRWLEEFSIPGYSAYEANQRTLEAFGTGAQPPHVIVLSSENDITANNEVAVAIGKVAAQFPDFRVASFYTTNGNEAYVSDDRRTTFADFYPPGQQEFDAENFMGEIRERVRGGRSTWRRRPPDRSRPALRVGGRRLATARACSPRR